MVDQSLTLAYIRKRFSEFDAFLASSNSSRYYDINRYAEDVLKDLLNAVYGYDLTNLNYTEKPDFPVVDLGDINNAICFQVTSNKSDVALKTIESRFYEHKINEKYPKLHLFFLSFDSERTKVINALKKTNLPENQVLDFNSIIEKIQSLEGAKKGIVLEKIKDLLDSNYIRYSYFEKTLKKYRETAQIKFDFKLCDDFIEPFLIEESITPSKHEDEWEENHLLKFHLQREYGKTSLQKVFSENNQFIITGEPGSGKSEILKHIYYSTLEENEISSKEDIVPVFIDVSGTPPDKIENIIIKEIDACIPDIYTANSDVISRELSKFLLKTGALCLLIDGYDELRSNGLKEWNKSLRIFTSHYSEAKIIVAVRRNRIAEDINLPIKKIYGILSFDDKQLEEYIHNVAKKKGINDAYHVKSVLTDIKGSRIRYSVATLIVKMLVDISLENNSYEVPKSKAAVYQQYFQYVIEKRLKGIGIENPRETLGNLHSELMAASFNALSQVALYNFKHVKTSLAFPSLDNVLEKIEAKINPQHLFQKGLNFFVNELHIAKISEKDNKLQFNHYTYQEFFTAYYLKLKLSHGNSLILRWIQSAYIVSRYQQIFLFLAGLLNHNECEKFISDFRKTPFSFRLRLANGFDQLLNSKLFFIGEIASESFLSQKTIEGICQNIRKLLNSKELPHFQKCCSILSKLKPGDKEVFTEILNALEQDQTWKKRQGLIKYAASSIGINKIIIEEMKTILSHQESYIRDLAITFFSQLGIFRKDITEEIIPLYFTKESHNRNEVIKYMWCLSKVDPDSCYDFIEMWKNDPEMKGDHKQKEAIKIFISYFAGQEFNIPKYKSPETEQNVLNILSDNENLEIKGNMMRSLAKTGIRNETIVKKISDEVLTDSPFCATALMYFRDLRMVRAEIVERAISLLDSKNVNTRVRAVNYLEAIHYSCQIEYNGRQTLLAEKIRDMLYGKIPNTDSYGYEIDYLGNVNYRDEQLDTFLLEKMINKEFGSQEKIFQYFMKVKHYSNQFFETILRKQTIRDTIDLHSFVSDEYFEHLDRYVPDDKIIEVRNRLFEFFALNALKLYRLRKQLFNNSSQYEMVGETQIQRFVRTSFALQKILLMEDEQKQFKYIN